MGKISKYKVSVDGITYRVAVEDDDDGSARVTEVRETDTQEAGIVARERIEVRTHLPGNVYDVLCEVGDEVKKGDSLVMLEAMKMQSPVYAPENGVIDAVEVEKGDIVKPRQILVYIA